MDPTRPVLDLYPYKNRYQSSVQPKTQQTYYKTPKMAPEPNHYSFQGVSSDKYESMHTAFNQQAQVLKIKDAQLHQYKQQNQKIAKQLTQTRQRNGILNETIIRKNQQLEEVYKRLQRQLQQGSRNRKFNSQGVEQLQTNIRNVINSNFSKFRDQSLHELRTL